ncbi:MAG: Thioredoxin [Bacteroidetes bacterium HLUCCA01]|nr:MAG: Thioredoxin [Bacteroidetes bacterium HLUCCA01]
MHNVLAREILEQAMDYQAYKKLIEDLFSQGLVTGPQQSESLTNYTKMNLVRMKRLEKTTVVPEDIVKCTQTLNRPVVFLTITEGWCGDAAQIIPVVQKICDTTPLLSMRFILRDENPEIMDHYLTNGARSIPKIIGLDAETLREYFVWGPRPEPAGKVRTDLIQQGASGKEVAEALHRWYAKDQSAAIFSEFEAILRALSAVPAE